MKRKINVLGKVCRIIVSVLTVLTIIGASFALIGGIVLTVLPQDGVQADVSAKETVSVYGAWVDNLPDGTVDRINEEIKKGALNFHVNNSAVSGVSQGTDGLSLDLEQTLSHFTLRRAGLAILAGTVLTGCLIYILITLGNFMKKLEVCDSPFSDGVVKAMTNFAISLIPYAILKSPVNRFTQSILTTGNVNINFSLDLTTVVSALVIILFIIIFKYGAKLQRESDETL